MEPLLGSILLTGINFVPKGWASCDGATLPIAQNQALYVLLGTRFGGNGTTTFNLPKLDSPDGICQYIIAVQGIFPQRQ